MDKLKNIGNEKIKKLVVIAGKRNNALEYQDVIDFFEEENLDPGQVEIVLGYLEKNDIDVFRMSEGSDDLDEFVEDLDSEYENEDRIDYSVPDGVPLDDPVRLDLKEIGLIQLLAGEDEIRLAKLTERERKVITLRFGLLDGKAMTLEEVGSLFNVTRERIRQIEAKAIRKLHSPKYSKFIRGYIF